MKPEVTTRQIWLLRAWLYALPSTLLALTAFFFWIAIPSIGERALVCLAITAFGIVKICEPRIIEVQYGLEAKPTKSELLYVAVGLIAWLAVMLLTGKGFREWQASTPFLMLMSMAPMSSLRLFRTKPQVTQ